MQIPQYKHNAQQQQKSQSKIPQHNLFIIQNKISETQTQSIRFDSDFDSGNMKTVERKGPNHFQLATATDGEFSNTEVFQKSWFHFSVSGFEKSQMVKFQINQLTMLFQISKLTDGYRPVFKTKNNNTWRRLNMPASILMKENNELELYFDFIFENSDPVFFAFSYPWSYEENCNMIKDLNDQYSQDNEIYFNQEIITRSPEGRDLHLITISSKEGLKNNEQEDLFNPILFPNGSQARSYKFRNNKPIVFFTARVHPGEVAASHSMNGIIKFLLSRKDARAYFLRKYFVFKIIPMLNPDGVYHGHYRMDIYGQNLNRFYDFPDSQKQPSCYAVRKLVQYYEIDKRLFYYVDLHSHPRKQGCFFYGNAVEDFSEQVESQVYAKLVSMNTINLEYDLCNFSKKHMDCKDKNENLTKQSCARVQVQKITNIIHCYTLETGYHSNNFVTELPPPQNIHRKVNNSFVYTETDTEVFQSDIYKRGSPLYTIPIYEQIGKAMLVSILDLFEKNPYSRVPLSYYKSMDNLRKDMAIQVSRVDRFKKDDQIQNKIKNIQSRIKDIFLNKYIKQLKIFEIEGEKNYQQQIQPKKRKFQAKFLKQNTTLSEKQNSNSNITKTNSNSLNQNSSSTTNSKNLEQPPQKNNSLKNIQPLKKDGQKAFKMPKISSNYSQNSNQQDNQIPQYPARKSGPKKAYLEDFQKKQLLEQKIKLRSNSNKNTNPRINPYKTSNSSHSSNLNPTTNTINTINDEQVILNKNLSHNGSQNNYQKENNMYSSNQIQAKKQMYLNNINDQADLITNKILSDQNTNISNINNKKHKINSSNPYKTQSSHATRKDDQYNNNNDIIQNFDEQLFNNNKYLMQNQMYSKKGYPRPPQSGKPSLQQYSYLNNDNIGYYTNQSNSNQQNYNQQAQIFNEYKNNDIYENKKTNVILEPIQQQQQQKNIYK